MDLESSSFTCVRACSWFGPQSHVLRLLRSSRTGCVSSAKLITIPINILSFETVVVGFIPWMAAVSSGSACIPVPSVYQVAEEFESLS